MMLYKDYFTKQLFVNLHQYFSDPYIGKGIVQVGFDLNFFWSVIQVGHFLRLMQGNMNYQVYIHQDYI